VPTGEQKRVLIVDDESRVAFFLEETLRALGRNLSVVSVGSAEEALEQLARQPFDLVVTDLRMPGMGGLELMRRVRETYPETRAILITAYGSPEVEAELYQLQPAFYLTKPFPVAKFTNAVEQALRLDRVHMALPGSPAGRTEAVRRTLATLRRGMGARCALLTDAEGQVVIQVGAVEGSSLETVLPLLAGEVSVTSRLEGGKASLHHYEAGRYQIYTAVAAEIPLLLAVLSQQTPPHRSGVTWLFLRRALQELRGLLLAEDATSPMETAMLGGLTMSQAHALGLSPDGPETEGDVIERGG